MPYKSKVYQRFCYLAWEVPTVDFVHPGKVPEIGNEEVNKLLATLPDDARIRAARLYSVVEGAWTLVDSQTSSQQVGAGTLKIFMAPEFYFRPETGGPHQPYMTYDARTASAIQSVVSRLFTADKFADWLIVAGTVVQHVEMKFSRAFDPLSHDRMSQETGKVQAEANNLAPQSPRLANMDYGFLNTAIVVKGGPLGPFRFIDKQGIASADFMPRQRNAADEIKVALTDWDHVSAADVFNYRAGAVFRFDNLGFGLEICADHSAGVLKELLEDASNRKLEADTIDFQLLTACGQGLRHLNCVARVGGHFLSVDGMTHGNNQKAASALYTVPQQRDDSAEFNKTRWSASSQSPDLNVWVLPDSLQQPLGTRAAEEKWTQRVVVYPVQKV